MGSARFGKREMGKGSRAQKNPGGIGSPPGGYRIKMVDSKDLESNDPVYAIEGGFSLVSDHTGRSR